MSYVVFKNISKSYQGNMVVQNINLEIEQGEFVSVLGPSGCGKTTTLRMLAGFIEPDEGEIYIREKQVFSRQNRIYVPPEKRNIGMVFQSYAVWPHMTVFENIAYPLKLRKLDRQQIASKVGTVLALVNMAGLEGRYPHELSGGQQQRVAIARAMVMEPAVLLLDEPLSNLDAKLREKMCREIDEIRRRTGITVVYVTHDQKEAISLSDKIVLMDRGRIIQTGSPDHIYEQPANTFSADFIGRANILKGTIGYKDYCGITAGKDMFLPVEQIAGNRTAENTVFLFRPEHVRITEAQDGYSGQEGVITYCNYFGSYLEYGIMINGAEIKAETDTQQRFKRGDRVFVKVTKAIVLEREDYIV